MGQLTVYLDTSHLRDFKSKGRTSVAEWLGVEGDVRLAISEVHLQEWMVSDPTMFLETLHWFSASFPDALFLPSLETIVGDALAAMYDAPAPLVNVVPLAQLASLDLYHMARASLTHHSTMAVVVTLNSVLEVHNRRKEEGSLPSHEYVHPKHGAFRRLMEVEKTLEQLTYGPTFLASEQWKRVRAFAKDTAPTVDFLMCWDDPITTERVLPALKVQGADFRARRRNGSPERPHWTFKYLMDQYEQQQSTRSKSGRTSQCELPRVYRRLVALDQAAHGCPA